MKQFRTLLFLLVCCPSYAEDYSWFENDWVRDREATMKNNPILGELSTEALDKLFLGYSRWKVKDGIVTLFPSSKSAGIQLTYSIQPVGNDGQKFVVHYSGGIHGEAAYLIVRKNTGFCTSIAGITLKDSDGNLTNEYWSQSTELAKLAECYVQF